MGGNNLRRDRRYKARIRVVLGVARGEIELFTENVSYRGLFLRTELALPTRELLRARIMLPNQKEALSTHVVVTSSRPGGYGVSFFGLDGELRTRWNRVVELARDEDALAGFVRADADDGSIDIVAFESAPPAPVAP
jgi:hypothetical protein